ncbi:MAG TPA: two-component regulator propeller domain-containing protein [Saprospiraceae bacterium]|nr:two-component regulator propeller domain-containing protein [Saprospiraceae bacterium]
MARQVVLLLCVFSFLLLNGQDYSFSHFPFDPDPGEVKGNVLYQDDDNRLWIGTDKGLLLFDGIQFNHEELFPTVSSLLSITALYVDDQHMLWIGTEEGAIFHGSPGNFEKCNNNSSNTPIRAMVRSQSGMLWAATYGSGLIAVCDSLQYRMQTGQLASDDVYAMVEDDEGRFWIGSDAGISIVNPDTYGDVPMEHHLGAREGIRDEIIIALVRTNDGLIWAGAFERGFCAVANSGKITYPYADWQYGPILSMAAVDDKEIWLSTERNGLWRYERKSGSLTYVEIPGNATPVIVDMTSDNEGNLWLLDVYRGLYRTNRRFESYHTELEGIQALLIDHRDQLYAGHPSGLYRMWPMEGTTPQRILHHVNVLSLYEDHHHNLWVGTFGQGLYCKPQGRSNWYHYTKDNGLTDESILSITGLENVIWLATLGGVTRIHVEDIPHPYQLETTNYNLADGLGTNFIYTARADTKGRVWFGTDGKGLSVLQNGQIHNFQKADTIPLHTVYSITEAVNGDICFVTDRDGVFRYDGSTFTHVELSLSLQDKEINNIVADSLGNLLLAHTHGVDILTPQHDIVRFQEFATDLLSPNLNAYFRDSSGTIWIAGQRQILRYNPLSSAQRSYPHNVLNDVRVFLEPVDFNQQHTFSASENYITFNYMGLWYTNPRDVTYRYKMEGLDPDWKETRERSVTYQHIPPGAYRFILESTCSGKYSAQNTIFYAFTINKPFYSTTAFVIISAIGVLMFLYVLLRLREQRVQRASSLQRRQIESQLQTLKAQINPHFLFNSFNTLVSVIEEDPHTAVEYVENLSDFYRSILQYREKNLIPLKEEIEIIKSYTYILQKRYGRGLRIRIPDVWPDVWVVPMVLQILVENAVKHNVISERKPLEIQIRIENDNAIVVENTLRKKQVSEESTGFGLQSIISRYALLCNRPVQVGQTQQVFYVIIPALRDNEIPDS